MGECIMQKCSEELNCFGLVSCEGCHRGTGWFADGLQNGCCVVGNGFLCGECWNGHKFGQPCDSVGDPLLSCFPDPCSVAPVVMHGWSQIPCVFRMNTPRSAEMGLDMHQDVGARWSNRVGLVGVLPKHLCIC